MSTSAPPTRCSVFDQWARTGLVWLPEHGMGWYPVQEAPYDASYFAKYEGYAATPMGEAITRARLELVLRHAWGAGPLCDVGIGCGDFLEAMTNNAYGFDINPAGVAWLEERGIFRDPREEPVEVLTFWDCLEHIADPALFLAAASRWVFVSLPIFTGPEHVLGSHHFRRDEHCWYWTSDGLIVWMAEHGFACVEHNEMETELGRADIHSYAFRRVA